MNPTAHISRKHRILGGLWGAVVGDALGVHPTALYRHFRDMDELIREAADHILEGLVEPK